METCESYDSDYDTYSDNDDSYYEDTGDYYGSDSGESDMLVDSFEKDPEHFNYKLINVAEAGKYVREHVDNVSRTCGVSTIQARQHLQKERWNVASVVRSLKRSNSSISAAGGEIKRRRISQEFECPVCYLTVCGNEAKVLSSCGHTFCKECWNCHFKTHIDVGSVGRIGCMQEGCECLVGEDFVMETLVTADSKARYEELLLMDYVVSHPELCFCPGPDCKVVVQTDEPSARRVNCDQCKSSFCFGCSNSYHAPVDCSTIKDWKQKCEDDSETANYMTAHTKDCPKCNVCIEKNGGCNHMQCYKCKHDFCWVCLGDWSAHGTSYYECSKYKETGKEEDANKTSARTALEKYIFYFQRWDNHARSLKLEQEAYAKIQTHIQEKVMQSQGTWIDWQYLLDAAELLHRCRYTLQYTYPAAYYMTTGPRKDCFENLQAQLEAQVENLSWKVERAEITDRVDLQRQMDIAEKRRQVLLKDFL